MITESITNALDKENLSLAEFKELVIRLMNYGILCRAENQVEQQLYDRYLRVSALVNEYLHLLDIQVYHDDRFEFIRLYPPGSLVPGMEGAEDSAFGGSLRLRLTQQEVALVLVLRLQYDKALHEGQVDENGFVAESIEGLSIAMKNLLGRNLPEKITERKRLFQRMRQLRLVQYRREEDIESGEAWLKIHPMIVSFVNEEALQALSVEQEEEDENTEQEALAESAE